MRRFFILLFLFSFLTTNAQNQDKVDFIHGDVLIEPIPKNKSINGSVVYGFEVLANVDSIFLDAKNLEVSKVLLDGKPIEYLNDGHILSIRNRFKKNKNHELRIHYSCKPEQTVYFIGWNDSITGNEQVWTQGQGKYTSRWLPSFDDMAEKVEFDFRIIANKKLQVIANGELIGKEVGQEKVTWNYDMKNPMSSYLLAFAMGDYNKQELVSSSGIPLINYFYPQDSLRVEPTYRYTKEIFDFLEKEIGVVYPWQNYKQIPVRDFLYAGMENTGTTIFSDQYMIDSIAFVDKNYVNVNAHELAHQWFGNLVTEKNGEHHWLHEGFATYYAYLTEQQLFGDDHYYWNLFKTANELQQLSERGEGQSLLDPKASSLTFYEKGAWALVLLRDLVGDKAFKNGIQKYLKRYQFNTVTISNFFDEMASASGKDLSVFRRDWLESTSFPFKEAMEKLGQKSPSVKLFLQMEAEIKTAQSDTIDYLKYWNRGNSIQLQIRMLEKYRAALPSELLDKAFQSDTVPVRQALLNQKGVNNLMTTGQLLSLLSDRSYITKEMALFNLWQYYPVDRDKYLEITKDVIGLPNKNVRLLWLTLAILTANYNQSNTQDYFRELNSYTGPEYSFEIRQNAFFYLKEAFKLNYQSLVNLICATNHHAWQFKKFARNLVDDLLKDPDYFLRMQQLAEELKDDDLRYIHTKFKN
ncbi:M1 family metallopeptidase [Maribacter aestuarii]|uniref:M1 family metallopeptidase n=1 Tax=Maribacter aestuarii TaxID=1130723 RepID=UPI0025A55E9D|nr:M1 family metallopeptidase [Maribacter aestuarii]